jgi:CheY-like chemotaxis protein
LSQRILIVDDYLGALRGINLFLREEGYEVDEAHDGAEALEKLLRQEFDLVLSDFVMPGIDGFPLLRQFLALARRTPVILMSGYPGIDRDMVILQGAADFITRPFLLRHLLQKIQHALANPS